MIRRRRPKVLIDIKRPYSDPELKPRMLNLSFKANKSRLKIEKRAVSVFIAVLAYAVMLAALPVINQKTTAQAPAVQSAIEEQQQLEQELAQYEAEIEALNDKILDARKKGKTLTSEIQTLNNKIAQVNLKIRAINVAINKLRNEINNTVSQISRTQTSISNNRTVLINAINKIYQADQEGTIQILLKSDQLSEFFNNVNSLTVFQDDVRATLENLINEQNKLNEAKNQLDKQRSEQENIRRYQAAQQAQIRKIATDKNNILKATKGQESLYQQQVAEKQKAAAEIRKRIFRLQGGGELQFGEAVRIAQIAERATGVRAAFILSILTQESAVSGVIGANLGRCYYNTPAKNTSRTVMSSKQIPVFLQIMASLGMDPAKTPVSCPIVADGAYGGAMGPAQFMPTTWILYVDRVSAITGGNPASPFNNLDAFTATALYLKDGLVGCRQIYTSQFQQENCAAGKYYAGGNWRNYMAPGRYGYRVADRAQDFQEDIDLLESN